MSAIEHAATRHALNTDAVSPDRGRVPSDTAFRCAIALAIVRVGLRLTEYGARRVSPAHPARTAYKTGMWAWKSKTAKMPWRGFVPTAGLISPTQSAWLLTAVFAANVGSYMLGLPYVHMDGLLTHHVPRLVLHLAQPAYHGPH
jgi:hypothetical protein